MLKILPNRPMKNYKPKIGFRVDAGNISGTGHLMEIVSLIKSIRKRVDFHAIGIVNEYPLCIEKLASLVKHVEIIPESAVGDRELNLIIPFLKREGVSFLVTDLLNRSPEYYDILKKELGNTYVIFDNDIHSETAASVVVNFNILQSQQFYESLNLSDTEYLIGPRYAVLDESLYDKWAKLVTFRNEVKKIFVNQGGSDPYGLTTKTLKALEKLHLSHEVLVVVGGALKEQQKKELEDLKPFLKENYIFFENIPQNKIYELLSESDMALTAAGNTLYELAFWGIPSVIICHHESHNKVATQFDELGAAINLGIGTEISETAIAEAIEFLLKDPEKRRTLSDNARRIVDGYGTGRLADRIAQDIKHFAVY